MTKSSMRFVVENFLKKTDMSLKQLSEETGVSLNTIKKLSSEQQTFDKTHFINIEELYLYAIKDNREFKELMHQTADEHHDILKGLVDK